MGIDRAGNIPKWTWGVRASGLAAALILLTACSGSSQQSATSADMTLTGSVGDGPIVGATIEGRDANGEIVFSATSDAGANYLIDVADGTPLPVTVHVSGGTDLVTGRPADFEMLGVALEPGATTLNVSPYTTLAVRTARCLGDLSVENLDTAWDLLHRQLNFGWDPALIGDPMGETVHDDNVATVLLGNEALGEVIRRTAAALAATDAPLDHDQVIHLLACDVADGSFDGVGSGMLPRASLTALAVATGVRLEVLAGALRVDGQNAMPLLDAALTTVIPGSDESVSAVAPTEALIDQTRLGLAVLGDMDPDLAQLAAALQSTTPVTARGDVEPLLTSGTLNDLDALNDSIALADAGQLVELVVRLAGAADADTPFIALNATDARVAPGESTTLSWSTTGAESCLASGAWSGTQPLEGTFQTAALDAAAEYVLSCSGLGGTAVGVVYVDVGETPTTEPPPAPAPEPEPAPQPDPAPEPPPAPEPAPEPDPLAPTLSFSVAPAEVDSGGTALLSWNSTGATQCAASGAWGGNRSVSGTQQVGPLTQNVAFTLTCSGSGGDARETVQITVNEPPPAAPVVTLSASETLVAEGAATTLSWSSSNATGCTASGAWSGDRATAGAQSTGPLAGASTFTLSCTGPGGTTSDSVSVTVSAADPEPDQPPPELSFTGSTLSVAMGQAATLSWQAVNASTCTASGAWSGARAVSGSESTGPLNAAATFTLSCSGSAGTVVEMLTVRVVSDISLSWVAPSENVDGSQLTDLAGYRIYYGTESGTYPNMVEVNQAGASSHDLSLASGDYHVVMTAVDQQGNESSYSNEVLKIAP